jgi:EAL domain-containing protein (putative c-di-GMP-specific phosphodiesterase class I)
MYAAKHSSRATAEARVPGTVETAIFSPADLKEALAENRFELFYQPQFSSTGELRGLEALLRLNDPILGIVTPDAFISVAERHELILSLGQWVLREAIADAVRWQLDKLQQVRVVVNVSARELENPAYSETVLSALREADYPASKLELEITERTVMRDITQAEQQLRALRSAGVCIAIDDFGAEYSCLSALHSLPIDTLKVDRSFIRALRSQPEVMRTIEAIVGLAHAMHKRVVVEGVETEKEVGAMLKLGDVDLQGFFFSRPQPADAITACLLEWRASGTDRNRAPQAAQFARADREREGPVH